VLAWCSARPAANPAQSMAPVAASANRLRVELKLPRDAVLVVMAVSS
jgi:hypothetical protein